ncbi:hypothetical protein EST38_g53 [Candolleomyces aberdarensis]|uniref:Uncharacterized protein n=1 Tax=Candolleomyces aberdarensis TaxID=2316362 RepID=A0A4Q2E1Y7_9AGAR|nr:hypothetical protein EST38_g53 [Candolleomyces aberdarensis]
MMPKLDLVPLQSPGAVSPNQPSPGRPSKLALKAKRAHERAQMPPTPPALPEPEYKSPVLPIFQPSPIHARAAPSPFASLLVDDSQSHLETKEGSEKGKKTPSSRNTVLSTTDSADSHPHRRKKKHISPPSAASGSSKPFAFDVPSPDDIVLQARKGTNLGRSALSSS